jgi:molybdopterin molybdotransferase
MPILYSVTPVHMPILIFFRRLLLGMNTETSRRFLKLVSVQEAEATLGKVARPLPDVLTPLASAAGRILAKPVTASADIPGFSRSAKDGYAVRSADILKASEHKPVLLKLTGTIRMGDADSGELAAGTAKYIPTGGVLPHGADAVVMQEQTDLAGDMVLIRSPVNPGSDIISANEDFSEGEVVFPAGCRITSRVAGVLAALGIDPVPVKAVPNVAVISTGNELIPPSETPQPGQIRDANSSLICSFLKEQGCHPEFYGIVRDEAVAVEPVLRKALLENDLVIISGGSSKDDRDVTAQVIAALGTVHIHGISVAPGKPTIIGTIQDKPVIGLPGHPASTYMITILFAGALLRAMTGETGCAKTVSAPLSMSFPSEKGREDLVRVKLLPDGAVLPVLGASGLLNTLIHSDGYIRVPAGLDGCEKGEVVKVYLWE